MSKRGGLPLAPGQPLRCRVRPRRHLQRRHVQARRARGVRGVRAGARRSAAPGQSAAQPRHRVGAHAAAAAEVGLEVRDTEALREHYGRTLRAWVENLRTSWDDALRHIPEPRAWTWLLYLAACALAFEHGSIMVQQAVTIRPRGHGDSGTRPHATRDPRTHRHLSRRPLVSRCENPSAEPQSRRPQRRSATFASNRLDAGRGQDCRVSLRLARVLSQSPRTVLSLLMREPR